MTDTHALVRTNPKGETFIGRCIKCGKTDLPSRAALEECPNPSGITQGGALLSVIEGNEDAKQ